MLRLEVPTEEQHAEHVENQLVERAGDPEVREQLAWAGVRVVLVRPAQRAHHVPLLPAEAGGDADSESGRIVLPRRGLGRRERHGVVVERCDVQACGGVAHGIGHAAQCHECAQRGRERIGEESRPGEWR